MVLVILSDGDFRECNIIDATVTFKRTVQTLTGTITRTRDMDIRQFPSVAEYVVKLDSEEYWAGVDCFAEQEA